jgi:hypothetical protein
MNYLPGLASNQVLLISVSQEVRITGVSHWLPLSFLKKDIQK